MNRVKTVLMVLLVLCLPVVHSLIPDTPAEAAGSQMYKCNTTGTTLAVCESVNGLKCIQKKTICKAPAETGNNDYCNNGTGDISGACFVSLTCLGDNNAEEHAPCLK